MRTFNHSLIVIFLLISSAIASKAQKKEYIGNYFTRSHGIIAGTFPTYRDWDYNPDKIKFVPASGEAIFLEPNNCEGFAVEGKNQYVTYSGTRMRNPTDMAESMEERSLREGIRNRYDTVSVFLKLIGQVGSSQFFSYRDIHRVNFFYRVNGQPIQELLYKVEYNQTVLTRVPIYKQQLKNVFLSDWDENDADALLEKMDYSERDFNNFIKRISRGKKKVLTISNVTE